MSPSWSFASNELSVRDLKADYGITLRQRRKQRRDGRVVAKGFAEVRETIYVAWSKDETSSQLKRILPQLVLRMTSGPGPRSRF